MGNKGAIGNKGDNGTDVSDLMCSCYFYYY